MNGDGYLDVQIMGREYRVACMPGQEDQLMRVVSLVDEKMRGVAARARNPIPERVAVMAAMSIAGDLLSTAPAPNNAPPSPPVVGQHVSEERIGALLARINGVLAET